MFTCKYCGKKFGNQRGVLAHQGRMHHEDFTRDSDSANVRVQSRYSDDLLDITNKELRELRASHSGICDVCGKTETCNTHPNTKSDSNNLCVDHDHNTKEFRGFLCVQCNRNFGWYDKYKSKIYEHEEFKHRRIGKRIS